MSINKPISTSNSCNNPYEAAYELLVTKAWDRMADSWENAPMLYEGNVFFDSFHTVMWGFPPKKCYSSEYISYIHFVADIMESDDTAVQVWKTYDSYINAYEEVLNDMDPIDENDTVYRHSIIHYHYLMCRFKCKLELDSSLPTEESKFWRAYEATVIRLIPSSENWTRAQWGDENNIHSYLLESYGIDFSDRTLDYDRIMTLGMSITKKKDITSHTVWYAMNIKELPYTMVETLWPKDTINYVYRFFITAYEAVIVYENMGKPGFDKKDEYLHASHVFDRSDLLKSWLFHLGKAWFYAGVFSDDEMKKLKAPIFDLTMASTLAV